MNEEFENWKNKVNEDPNINKFGKFLTNEQINSINKNNDNPLWYKITKIFLITVLSLLFLAVLSSFNLEDLSSVINQNFTCEQSACELNCPDVTCPELSCNFPENLNINLKNES